MYFASPVDYPYVIQASISFKKLCRTRASSSRCETRNTETKAWLTLLRRKARRFTRPAPRPWGSILSAAMRAPRQRSQSFLAQASRRFKNAAFVLRRRNPPVKGFGAATLLWQRQWTPVGRGFKAQARGPKSTSTAHELFFDSNLEYEAERDYCTEKELENEDEEFRRQHHTLILQRCKRRVVLR